MIKMNDNLINTWLSSWQILHWDELTVDGTICLTVDGARFSKIYLSCSKQNSKLRQNSTIQNCFYPPEVSEFQHVLMLKYYSLQIFD